MSSENEDNADAQNYSAVENSPSGTDLSYQITAANNGGQAAQGLVILDRIPTNADFKIGSSASTMPADITLVVEYSFDYDAMTAASAPTGYNRMVKAIR